jgi:hypothetical protein
MKRREEILGAEHRSNQFGSLDPQEEMPMNQQTMHIRGSATTADATPVRKVAIPIPAAGGWRITGTVFATDSATNRSHSVVFSPALSGYSVGGVAHENDEATGGIPMAPAAGFGVGNVAIAPVISGQGPDAPVCELQFTGAAGVNIAWGWSLFVEALGL